MTHSQIAVVPHLVRSTIIRKKRLWSLVWNGTGNSILCIRLWVAARERHETVDKDELGVWFGHFPQFYKNFGCIGVGPIVHDLLEKEDRGIRDRLCRKEIVS